MIQPDLAAPLKRWSKDDYAAGYRSRFWEIPLRDGASYSWHCGWDDADTEILESTRHERAVAEGREDAFPGTWMLLFDVGGDARVNGIPFDRTRTQPWKQGWIEADINLGVTVGV